MNNYSIALTSEPYYSTVMEVFEIYEPTGRILSTTNSRDFHGCIEAAAKSGVTLILIDFKNIMFMDSQGLGTLISARNRAESLGIKLALCSLVGQARMILEMSSVDQ
ncbi:MAG: STAS domain-containing protein [Synechococcales cyanobacterium T60_A2020_003]|nr:STAS domain-containing protein [Synechococcales cyanobacterium T60_A2020_003]